MRNKKIYLIYLLVLICFSITNNCGLNFPFFTNNYYPISFLTFNNEGNYLISVGNEIKIWDFLNQKIIKNITSDKFISSENFDFRYSSSYSPDGKFLATCNSKNTISIWDIDKTIEIKNLKTQSDNLPYIVKYSPNGKYLMSYSRYDKTIKIWNVSNFNEISIFSGNSHEITNAVFSEDNHYLVITHESLSEGKLSNTELIIWDFINNFFIYKSKISQTIHAIEFSPKNKYFVIYGKTFSNKLQNIYPEDILTIWDFETKKIIRTVKTGQNFSGEKVIFSKDGKYLACVVGGSILDGVVKIFDTNTWELFKEIVIYPKNEAYANSVNSISFSPDNNYIASSSLDLSNYKRTGKIYPIIKIWSLKTINNEIVLKP